MRLCTGIAPSNATTNKIFIMLRCIEIEVFHLMNLPPIYVVDVLYLQGTQNRRAQPHVWRQYTNIPLGHGQQLQPSTTCKYVFKLRRSRPKYMFGTKIKIIQNVLTIIDIDTEIQQSLLSLGINYVSKLIRTNHTN